MMCRHCALPLTLPLIDLGTAPPSNAYVTVEELRRPEKWYPLRVLVCERCWLAQTEDFAGREELFTADYAYFSGLSETWLAHCKRFVDTAAARFGLNESSFVVEVAANDGTLLHYVKERGIDCLGIEPTASTAAAARARGIPVVEEFFGARLARELAAQGLKADLMVANNVLAHVPDINDFAEGFTILLKPEGVATFEFPHLMRLILETQFDTIYHEHYSYLSLGAVSRVFERAGLDIFDVEQIPTHGGSLRVFAQRLATGRESRSPAVAALLRREAEAGMNERTFYEGFQARADRIKDAFLSFLLQMKREGRKVAAYGAAAKGNTLLNYAGVKRDLLPYVCDAAPSKQGKYMPGSRIPILPPAVLAEHRPDVIVILPWNIADEIVRHHDYVRHWRGSFAVAIPRLEIWS